MLGATAELTLVSRSIKAPEEPNNAEKDLSHDRYSQSGRPYFGLIFINYACGKAKGLPEQGCVDELSCSCFAGAAVGITAAPFAELNNPPFLIATTLGTMCAFLLACSRAA